MTMMIKSIGRLFFALFVVAGAGWHMSDASASEAGTPHVERQDWTFGGLFGTFDRAQLQRGYQVYKEVCAGCHGMKLIHFRNLGQPGGPEFPKESVDALAAEAEIPDGPNDEGEMFTRPGKASDALPSPFPNDKAAAAANGGAVPPDLSVMGKARGVHHDDPVYLAIFRWAREVVTGYQEGGPDYIYALLTGYSDAPHDMKMAPGMNYNAVFPGHQIAMPSPLSDEAVEYSDGTPATLKQHAKDVSAFLMWAADPTLEQRKKTGFRVMLYLIILTVLMYFVKKAVWRDVAH